MPTVTIDPDFVPLAYVPARTHARNGWPGYEPARAKARPRRTTIRNGPINELSVDELRNRLQDLEGEKDTEIKALRHRYAAKRKPNEAAIKSKQGSHCQHALCSVWSTAGNHRFTHLKTLAVHDACDGTVPVERPSAVAITQGAA